MQFRINNNEHWIERNSVRLEQTCHSLLYTPQVMAEHVHYLKQRLYAEVPWKIIKLSKQEKNYLHITHCMVKQGMDLLGYIYFTNGCKHTGVGHHLKQ